MFVGGLLSCVLAALGLSTNRVRAQEPGTDTLCSNPSMDPIGYGQCWYHEFSDDRHGGLFDAQEQQWMIDPVMLGLSAARMPTQELGTRSTDPACSNPPMDQCAFYAHCLEPRYQCGPDGYPIGYGQHYCQTFSDNRGLFDAQGQQWMLATMHCLQRALVGDAVDATPVSGTCAALKDEAFASHAGCYAGNGFCGLGVRAWEAVLAIVDVRTLFSSWDAFKATMETAAECGAFYAYMVEREMF